MTTSYINCDYNYYDTHKLFILVFVHITLCCFEFNIKIVDEKIENTISYGSVYKVILSYVAAVMYPDYYLLYL